MLHVPKYYTISSYLILIDTITRPFIFPSLWSILIPSVTRSLRICLISFYPFHYLSLLFPYLPPPYPSINILLSAFHFSSLFFSHFSCFAFPFPFTPYLLLFPLFPFFLQIVYGESSLKVAESMQNLATILGSQGLLKEAETYLRK